MKIQDDDALRYYWQELNYLRDAGKTFARRYPKVAGRLELESDGSPDPHIERLIEAFAFLTGRIQQNLDNEFPEIAAELLGIVYPHFTHPIPSMSICQLEVDAERGKLTSGYPIPPRTPLFVHDAEGQICRFRTCYPVSLWPVEVRGAAFAAPEDYDFLDQAADVAAVLRIELATLADPLHELEMPRLRFFLNGDRILATTLYELLMSNTMRVAFVAAGESEPLQLERDAAIRPVGFGLSEEVLPFPAFAQPAYRLLQEYFVFPAKYWFFDLMGLDQVKATDTLEVLFLLDHQPKARLPVDRDCFRLGCTPIINLFPQTTEPIRLDQQRLDYLLVPDSRRWESTEIHSIDRVSGSSNPAAGSREYRPFYSFDHKSEAEEPKTFWHGQRRPSPHPDGVGSDIYLSFLDLDFKPDLPPDEVLYAHTLCTNRDLAEQLPAGCLLQTDAGVPCERIVCLLKPSRQMMPPLRGQTLWRLVSHLSLNYLSLSDEEAGVKAFREMLRLYDFTGSASAQQEINGIRSIQRQPVVKRFGPDASKGFTEGQEVTLSFDEDNYTGGAAFLFASVLNHFFALYSSTNSFTQLVIRSEQKEGEWHRWPPMAGEKTLQ